MPRRGHVPTRTCIACRARRPPADLVRLSAADDGSLRVGPGPGRGAWVCPGCVGRLERRPRPLGRALRRPDASAEGLVERVRAWLVGRARAELRACRRAGLVADGRARALAVDGALAFAVAVDASPRLRAELGRRGVPVADLGLDARALGRLVGRGPRAVVAVRPARRSRRLARFLQHCGELG